MVKAIGYGLKLIQCPITKVVIPLWPTYYMPTNPQCTFSPTALTHYLKYKTTTTHLEHLSITTSNGTNIKFPSVPRHSDQQLLDYHEFIVVRPNPSTPITISSQPIANSATSELPLTRLLVHQRLGHGCDTVLDTMCRNQTLLGLPKRPFPSRSCPCPICITTKFTNTPKVKQTLCPSTVKGELLHIDFSFWNVTSVRGFSSLLSIIDGSTRMLWNFPTASKRVPLTILEFFFGALTKENISILGIRVDEDGALANNTEFSNFLLARSIPLESTGGYASYLNGKIERPHRTIANMVRAMLLNSGLPSNLWCYAAETAADIYRYTHHSALGHTPYEAWYKIKPHINNLRVWGCYVYVRVPNAKKLDHRVTRGYFLGFTKSRLIVRWFDPTSKTVKHASAVRFDEMNTKLHSSDTLSPGALILSGQPSPDLSLDTCVDIVDHPHLETVPFTVSLQLPRQGIGLGCFISTDIYHNLPYISSFTPGTPLASQLLQHGQHNSSFWILSLHSKEFSTAPKVIDFLKSLQIPDTTIYIEAIFARRVASQRTSLSGNRVIFNQIRLRTDRAPVDDSISPSVIVPVGMKVVSSPVRPDTPSHFGATYHSPFASDWRDALFQNYDKMLTTGTFSAPILRTSVPPNKTVLRPRVACRVKDTSIPHQYDLYARTCADGSTQREHIDYTDSYSPVASIDSIRLLLNLAASTGLLLSILDISNAFQNSIIFDASDRVYLSLPPLYLDWFRQQWPDYQLPSLNIKDLVIQCLKSIQGTKDAGQRWYKLLAGVLLALKMIRCSCDHGIFVWHLPNETCYVAIETDDLLFLSKTRSPFLQLKLELEKLFDLTVCEGSVLKFLNLRIIQSPHGISFDQTQHIQNTILHDYFQDVPPTSIPRQLYPFPLEATFEKRLYEAAPLVGIDLTNATKRYRFSFGHLVGCLMHISHVSRPDLAYAVMRYSGYMACPNLPIFEALHLTLCYLYHHPHLPIMYPSRPYKTSSKTLQTHWTTGFAEYLPGDYGDGLATFADADFARCLRSRRSVSASFHLLNGVIVSWNCKKQPVTTLHSSGAELTSLHRAGFKSSLLQSFLQAINNPLQTPAVLFEDNKGTINLIRTQRLTDTVRHHDVKLAWLNENFLRGTFTVAYSKSALMLVDCSTKPVNGAQLFQQISFAIGVRFYPLPSENHYLALDLANFSWNYRFKSLPSPS